MSDLPTSNDLIDLFDKVEQDPDSCEARLALAEALFEVEQQDEAVNELLAAAEILGKRGEFDDCISILTRILEIDPDHKRANELRATYYQSVPRSADSASFKGLGEDENEGFGSALFELPVTSAKALARILPFSSEDPKPPAGPIIIPTPSNVSEPNQPLLAALDKELRRNASDVMGDGMLRVTDSSAFIPVQKKLPARVAQSDPVGESVEEDALEEAFQAGFLSLEDRVYPASDAISVEVLPPNAIIDLLSSERLQLMLEDASLLRYEKDQALFELSAAGRVLYVIVRGTVDVEREVEGRGNIKIDQLSAGDFFGEFELLTVAPPKARLVASQPADILEIPKKWVDEITKANPEVTNLLWDIYFQRSFHSMMATSRLFVGLPRETINLIAADLEPRLYEPGDMVLRTGEKPKGIHGVVGGNLVVMRGTNSTEILTRLVPGDTFGVVSTASRRASRARVIATEDTTVLWLSSASIEALSERSPTFKLALEQACRDRVWRYKLSQG